MLVKILKTTTLGLFLIAGNTCWGKDSDCGRATSSKVCDLALVKQRISQCEWKNGKCVPKTIDVPTTKDKSESVS